MSSRFGDSCQFLPIERISLFLFSCFLLITKMYPIFMWDMGANMDRYSEGIQHTTFIIRVHKQKLFEWVNILLK